VIEFKEQRNKNDIFAMPLLGFMFKNKTFITALRVITLTLFVYGIYLGFMIQTQENIFTKELFWGLFWSLFMVITLSTFGRIFCGICPHGFLGKHITKIGKKLDMPSWLQNPWWGLGLIIIGWWGVYYIAPRFLTAPFATAMLFSGMTILAFIIFYLYKDMSYCKYICPIGSLTKAYQRVSFTWLGSYKEDCKECKTFSCASACPYNLKPFTFNTKNSMEDCSLCMECAQACDAISFSIVPPANSLYKKFKFDKIEVWTYILITAAISITMSFHHGLGRSPMAEKLPWAKTAEYFKSFIDFGSLDAVGLFAFIYANVITLILVGFGMFVASKALKASYSKTFYTLGYAFAPLFLIGGLSHLLNSFFTHEYAEIVKGFAYGFGFENFNVENLASRKDAWLVIFDVFKYAAALLAFYIMYKRINLFEASKKAKSVAFIFASLLIIFYLMLNLSRVVISSVYGASKHGSHMQHGSAMQANHGMYQSVTPNKAVILQDGAHKEDCVRCGMNLPKWYKTNHAATTADGKVVQYCSLHCATEHANSEATHDLRVVDTKSLEFIDAQGAFYVVGSSKKGTMSKVSKYAFRNLSDAKNFAKEFGGQIMSLQEAKEVAQKDFKK
jgi:hypothetical protein